MINFTYLSWKSRYCQFIEILLQFQSVITDELNNSWLGLDFGSPEDEIIKKYLLDKGIGIDYLNSKLAPLLSKNGFKIKFASVFTHQKPLITRFVSPCAKCELGDLLIVFTYMDRLGNILLNRAILSQAKKTNKNISTCQRKLYDEDMGFLMPQTICSSSTCSKFPERFFPRRWEDRCRALKYLILDPSNISFLTIPWGTSVSLSFSLTMWLFMLGYKGCQFSRKPYRSDGWSAIVWDLINVVGKPSMSKKYGSMPRGNYLSFLLNFSNYLDNDSSNCRIEVETEDGGIPSLWILVKDSEIRKG